MTYLQLCWESLFELWIWVCKLHSIPITGGVLDKQHNATQPQHAPKQKFSIRKCGQTHLFPELSKARRRRTESTEIAAFAHWIYLEIKWKNIRLIFKFTSNIFMNIRLNVNKSYQFKVIRHVSAVYKGVFKNYEG